MCVCVRNTSIARKVSNRTMFIEFIVRKLANRCCVSDFIRKPRNALFPHCNSVLDICREKVFGFCMDLCDICLCVWICVQAHGSYRNNHVAKSLWFQCSDDQHL